MLFLNNFAVFVSLFLMPLSVYVNSQVDLFFSSQIQLNMSKQEVISIVDEPYYIVGREDPFYFEHKQEQQKKYGYIIEVWYYVYPERVAVYFKDGKVSEVIKLKDELSPEAEE